MSGSQFRRIGLARVVEDQPSGSVKVVVTPIEELYDQESGLVDKFKEQHKGNLLSTNQTNEQTENVSTNKINAIWRPTGNTNQITPPNVYRGESVDLYRYGNTQQYYWDKTQHEHNLRGREKVITAYSNREGGDPNEEATLDNSYTVEFNTKDKKIEIKTATNDGEACGYTININTKDGIVTIQDTVENSIVLNSPEGTLTGNIKEKITLNTKEIEFNCENMVVNASESYTLNTVQESINASGQSDTVTPLATFSDDTNVGNDTVIGNELTTGSNAMIGGNLLVAGTIGGGTGGGGGKSSIRGDFEVIGNTTTTGNDKITGNSEIDGDLTVSGSANGSFPGPKS